MRKDTPVYPLDGTDFFVDALKGEFREVGNTYNKIPFGEMTMWDDHYDLLYNKEVKNTPMDCFNPDNMVILRVPMIKDLDPDGFSKKHGVAIGELKGKTDFELIFNQEVFKQLTTEGYIRQVTIYDHVFEVDLYTGQLHSEDGTLPSIRLSDFSENWYGKLFGYYDTITGLMVKPEDIKGLPISEHTIRIEIASAIHLDQVTFSKIYGLSIKDTLWRHPPDLKITAKEKPLSQSAIGKQFNSRAKVADEKTHSSRRKKSRGLN